MKKTILLVTVLLGAATVSQAGVHVGLGFTIPLTVSPPRVVVSQPPVAQAPAPVYQAPPVYQVPAPVYQAPPPAVVYAPAPAVVYAPPPVVYAPAPSIYLGFGSVWGGHYRLYAPYRGHWGHAGWHR